MKFETYPLGRALPLATMQAGGSAASEDAATTGPLARRSHRMGDAKARDTLACGGCGHGEAA